MLLERMRGGAVLDPDEDGVSLRLCQPPSGRGTVGENKEENDAQNDCGKSLDSEEPLPTRQTQMTIETHQRAGQGAHDDDAQRPRNIKAGDAARSQLDGKPLGDVKDYPGEETGFGNA